MIYINRKSVRKPQIISVWGAKALKALERHYAQDLAIREQKLPPIDTEFTQSPPIRKALATLFNSRCGFCETPIPDSDKGAVIRFRPSHRADNPGRGISPDHYWWLSYDWSNLYLACSECRHSKGQKFPVRGKRAPIGTPHSQILKFEDSILLDPCFDSPESSLGFTESGHVEGLDERGKVTISVFGLNRISLVQQRLVHLKSIQAELSDRKGKDYEKIQRDSLGFGFRALTQSYLEKGHAPGKPATASPRRSAQSPARQPISASIWVENVEISNFKAIRELKLSFPKPDSSRQPWVMLVGENGVGKSSVLKAIALALIDADSRRSLVPNASSCLRDGASSGSVTVRFNVTSDPIVLGFRKGDRSFTHSGRPPQLSLLAYGSTRLLPPAPKRLSIQGSIPKRRQLSIRHLFRSHEPLVDVERWLANPKHVKPRAFRLLASSFRKLLDLQDSDLLARPHGRLVAKLFKKSRSIRELSDGYQSAFALASNILFNLSISSLDMESVEGTVLLDEIEVHLHPSWKMRVVKSLREMFPRVRFIATTHDPLCLQGMERGEVHRMSRHPETNAVILDQIDVPLGMRADQLLTGSWFGLETTRDPDTINLFDEHGKLILMKRKSRAEQTRQAVIEATLRDRLGRFNDTAVESVALKAVAEARQEGRRELNTGDKLRIRTVVARPRS